MLPQQEGTWTSTLNMLRCDLFQDEDSWGDEEMYVKYIAFFASEADANAYTFASAPAAAPEAPAAGETTTTPEAAPEAGAAQTADMASVAAIALVAAAAVVVASKKR